VSFSVLVSVSVSVSVLTHVHQVKELLGVPVDQVELPEILGGRTGSLPVLEAMKRIIFEAEDGGLSGDNQDYYNPDNSRIDQVSHRSLWWPIM